MAFDFKKEEKAFYLPGISPAVITLPQRNYIAVRGEGDPNEDNRSYKAAVNLLYGLAYTIKMSRKGSHQMPGYFDFIVPPLEGLWRQAGGGMDYSRKEDFRFIALMRLPDFVTLEEFSWAAEEASRKKKTDFFPAEFFPYEEGTCVQCMHVGPYDREPATVAAMDAYAEGQGYAPDISETRWHHEIYLSDPRKTPPDKLKTVLRHPIKKEDA